MDNTQIPPKEFDPTKPPKGYRVLGGSLLRTSPKATLFEVETVDGKPRTEVKSEWFPISQTKATYVDTETVGGDYIIVSQWIFDTKGL